MAIKLGTKIVNGLKDSSIYASIDSNIITTGSLGLSTLTPGKTYLLDSSGNSIDINCDLNSTEDIGKQWTFVLVSIGNPVDFKNSSATPYSTLPGHFPSIVTSSYATVTATQITTSEVIVQGSLQPI